MKPIENMNRDELQSEIEHMQHFFNRCEEVGQGISSKETVRMRALRAALGATLDTGAALDIVDSYKTSRGLPGTLDALMSMQRDRDLTPMEMAGYDVAFAGFSTLFAPVEA